jgi:hypothetical protein
MCLARANHGNSSAKAVNVLPCSDFGCFSALGLAVYLHLTHFNHMFSMPRTTGDTGQLEQVAERDKLSLQGKFNLLHWISFALRVVDSGKTLI